MIDVKRLYKKGDKVVITLTVTRDQSCLTDRVMASDPGYYGQGPLGPGSWYPQMLDAGVLTPAPEPKYVPKVGDTFYGASWHSESPYTLVYKDEAQWVIRQHGRLTVIDATVSALSDPRKA